MIKQLQNNRITALYCRLSKDDGYTGTNFDRPDFQRLLKLVENDEVGIIAVKDLSRLGREYLKTGYYTEIIFPAHDVRFIAVNDGVDSIEGDNEFAPLKNVINEWYAKDASRKSKATMKLKASHGEYINGRPPYGYRRDPERRNHLIPDENMAPVVKRMFDMAFNGCMNYQIARAFKEEKIPRSGAYKLTRDGRYVLDPDCEDSFEWSRCSVRDMLSNQTYLGHLFSQKTSHRSFKDKRVIHNPEEAWIKLYNDHEALVNGLVLRRAKND